MVAWGPGPGATGSRPHYRHDAPNAPTASFDLPISEAAIAMYTTAILGLLALIEMEKRREYEDLVGLMTDASRDQGTDYQAECIDPDTRRRLRRVAHVNTNDHDVFADYTDEELGFS